MDIVLTDSESLESSVSSLFPRFSTYLTMEYCCRLILIIVVLPLSVFLLSLFVRWDSNTSYVISVDRTKALTAQVISLMSDDEVSKALDGLKRLLPWIFYHKVIGVSEFFLFVEGQVASVDTSKVLESIPEAGMEWIFHFDTDELLHPTGTKEYSMVGLLTQLPEDVDTVVFLNHVSLFKRNSDHLPNDSNFNVYYHEATRSNPSYFIAYGNGKSGARIQDGLSPSGAHRWEFDLRRAKEVTLKEAAILHYTYARFSDLTSRRDRCNCKPTMEDTEKCFFLPFERYAFIIASNSTEPQMRQWYNKHVVWNDETLKDRLLKAGILTRIYAPSVIIRRLMQTGVLASAMSAANATSSVMVESSYIKDNATSSGT